MNEKPTHIDLFSGIGGFALAARWTGYETIVFCEKDEWCQRVLAKNFGAVVENSNSTGGGSSNRNPLHKRRSACEDRGAGISKDAERKDGLAEPDDRPTSPLLIPDIFNFDGTKYTSATLLTGGFPCQPFSVAGKRRGKEDDRHLWPEMLRVISEARPTWVIGENVAGFVPMELDDCLSDLEGVGYETQAFIIPACAVGAPHRRDRVWIVAHTSGTGTNGQGEGTSNGRNGKAVFTDRLQATARLDACRNSCHEDVAHTDEQGSQGWNGGVLSECSGQQPIGSCCAWLPDPSCADTQRLRLERAGEQRGMGEAGCIPGVEGCQSAPTPKEHGSPRSDGAGQGRNMAADRFSQSIVGRVAHGIPKRVDRLRGLGNAIVPQVAAEMMRAIRISEG